MGQVLVLELMSPVMTDQKCSTDFRFYRTLAKVPRFAVESKNRLKTILFATNIIKSLHH